VYTGLVDKFGSVNVFVLSAGWGLIRSGFLTPQYDITFSPGADPYKRRRRADRYLDFQQLASRDEQVLFLGGADYLPLFCALTAHVQAGRIVYFNSVRPPDVPHCRAIRYETTRKTNWHYACAADLIAGKLSLPEEVNDEYSRTSRNARP
jgi:hypothetical protein